MANIADRVVADARDRELSDRQLKEAISEFSQALTVLQKPNAKFNRQPIERLENSLNQLKRYQNNR